jgi:hypothetical protein
MPLIDFRAARAQIRLVTQLRFLTLAPWPICKDRMLVASNGSRYHGA